MYIILEMIRNTKRTLPDISTDVFTKYARN
jgi:hypothetical protein